MAAGLMQAIEILAILNIQIDRYNCLTEFLLTSVGCKQRDTPQSQLKSINVVLVGGNFLQLSRP